MAIDTYSELKTVLADWLSRADLTSRIPEAIADAEAKFQRSIRHREMEQVSTATATEYLELPTDYLELRRIQLNTSTPHPLRLYSPAYGSYLNAQAGEPKYYTMEANQIRLIPAPDSGYEVEVNYWKKIPALSDSQTTNWLLTDHPDVYMYGSMVALCWITKDWEAMAVAKRGFDEAMGDLIQYDRRQRWSGGPMAMVAG